MRPPAQTLDWKAVMDLTFVSEFDLLRQSYGDVDILTKPWMEPANRTICNNLFKVMRAREEIIRLNVEVRRLRTWLFVEDDVYRKAIASALERGEFPLATELNNQYRRRRAVNTSHHRILNKIENLRGFTGQKGLGTPVGWTEEMVAQLKRSEIPVDESGGEEAAELEREACRDDVSRLAEEVENLSI